MKLTSITRLQVLAVTGVLLGTILAIAIRASFQHRTIRVSPATANATMNGNGPTVAETVARHLNWADQQAAAGLDPQLNPIRDLFKEAKAGTRAFSEDALGFDSKWALITGFVRGNDDHRRYLAERFAARLFAPEDLERVVKYAAQAYLTHLDNVDAMLLVNLKADLANIPSSGFSPGMNASAIEQAMHTAINDAVRAVEADFPWMIGREVVSNVAGDLIAAAGVRLATSAGILSVGASSGAVTVGGGLVLSIIIDYVVSWAWDKIANPCGELSRKLDETLTQLEQVIVNGYGNEPGLYKRLVAYAARRSQARKTAINSVVR